MGGLKIHTNDHSHKAFVNWIEDYANVTNSRYKTVDDLPPDNWFPTQRILRLKEVPEAWKTGSTIQMFVHERDEENNWSQKPIGFTQGTVTPRRIVNGALILLAPTGTAEYEKWKQSHNRLPSGDYLIKVYLDSENHLSVKPTEFLTDSDFVGKAAIKNAAWRVGFPNAEWISANELEE